MSCLTSERDRGCTAWLRARRSLRTVCPGAALDSIARAPHPAGGALPDAQQMPDTAEGPELRIYCVVSCTYIPMRKINLEIRHRKRLTTVTKNTIEQLSPYCVGRVVWLRSLKLSHRTALTPPVRW